REAATGGSVLADEPVAVPFAVGARVPGDAVDHGAAVAHSVEPAIDELVAQLRLAFGAAQHAQVDEVAAVRTSWGGAHAFTLLPPARCDSQTAGEHASLGSSRRRRCDREGGRLGG